MYLEFIPNARNEYFLVFKQHDFKPCLQNQKISPCLQTAWPLFLIARHIYVFGILSSVLVTRKSPRNENDFHMCSMISFDNGHLAHRF